MGEIAVRAAGVLLADGRILLVNHVKHGRSYWVLPGGHVNFGETLEQALVREMKEECDLDVTVGPLLIVHDYINADNHVVNNTFRIEAKSADFHVRPEGSLKGARWVPLEELDRIDLKPSIADVLRKIVNSPPTNPVYLGRV
jgi:ADP-ribose pyrophosphatase YjhB (NUDIX family)